MFQYCDDKLETIKLIPFAFFNFDTIGVFITMHTAYILIRQDSEILVIYQKDRNAYHLQRNYGIF